MGCKSEGTPACYQGAVGAPSTLPCQARFFVHHEPPQNANPFFASPKRFWKGTFFWVETSDCGKVRTAFCFIVTILPHSWREPYQRKWVKWQLWQEICTTDQQLTWWKPIFPSKMVFPEWLTRQLKWLQKKKKGYRSNYLKSCLILVYFTNDNKLSHFSSALLQLFIRISIKSFLLFLIPLYFHFLFRDFRLQLWTLAPLCCFSSCTSRLGADWNKVTSPLPAPEQSPGQGATPWINTLWVTLLLRLGAS